jgi:hypothetical protein
VVPARARPVLTASAASAFTSSAAFSAATTPSPHRVVIFSRAVGLRHPGPERDPAEPGPGDRAGHLPAQRLAAQPAAVLQEHHPQAGPDRDRRPPDSAGKCAAYGAKNTGSSSSASTRASPAGSCWYSGGQEGLPPPLLQVPGHQHRADPPSSARAPGHDLVIRALCHPK